MLDSDEADVAANRGAGGSPFSTYYAHLREKIVNARAIIAGMKLLDFTVKRRPEIIIGVAVASLAFLVLLVSVWFQDLRVPVFGVALLYVGMYIFLPYTRLFFAARASTSKRASSRGRSADLKLREEAEQKLREELDKNAIFLLRASSVFVVAGLALLMFHFFSGLTFTSKSRSADNPAEVASLAEAVNLVIDLRSQVEQKQRDLSEEKQRSDAQDGRIANLEEYLAETERKLADAG
jgi:hypothetical protein